MSCRGLGDFVTPAAFDSVTYFDGGVRWYRPEVESLVRGRLDETRAQAFVGVPDLYTLLFASQPYGSGWVYNAGELVSAAENDPKGMRYVLVSPEAVWPIGDGRMAIHGFPQQERSLNIRGAYLRPKAFADWQNLLKGWGWSSSLVDSSGAKPAFDPGASASAGSGGDAGSRFFVIAIAAVLAVAAALFVEANHERG